MVALPFVKLFPDIEPLVRGLDKVLQLTYLVGVYTPVTSIEGFVQYPHILPIFPERLPDRIL
jgi:hypothetical protein